MSPDWVFRDWFKPSICPISFMTLAFWEVLVFLLFLVSVSRFTPRLLRVWLLGFFLAAESPDVHVAGCVLACVESGTDMSVCQE